MYVYLGETHKQIHFPWIIYSEGFVFQSQKLKIMNLLCKVIIANYIGKLHFRKKKKEKKKGCINITKRIKKLLALNLGLLQIF